MVQNLLHIGALLEVRAKLRLFPDNMDNIRPKIQMDGEVAQFQIV